MALTLRLDIEQDERLEKLASLLHTSKTSVLKQAIDEKYERELGRARFRSAAATVEERDQELLDRLAET